MVEYAILTAGSGLHVFAANATNLAANVQSLVDGFDWNLIGYAALALLALRIVSWAFRPSH